MFQNYFKIGWRNLFRNKAYSFINIGGLSTGMAVAMLIGLWVYDELSFNKYNRNYETIAQVLQHQSISDGLVTYAALPLPVATELRNNHGNDFAHVAAAVMFEQFISHDDKVFTRLGSFAEPQFADIISIDMVRGVQNSLQDPSSILISESLAFVIFGLADPINKEIKVNNTFTQKITGVYKDLPKNSRFHDIKFIAPLSILVKNGYVNENWQNSSFGIYTQLHAHSDVNDVSKKIKNILFEKSGDASKPVLILSPMRDWHLYEFKNGIKTSGRLQFVWLFGIIGVFVLLLACINFMNLSTARSIKRAREVGIRKTMGSVRGQLIFQFFSESLLTVLLSFALSLVVVISVLPLFMELADKTMAIPWSSPNFWMIIGGFVFLTVLLAGSYPALYLSSFNPVKVLKGTFQAGRFASLPRKLLVVFQFTISVALITGTIIVFQQIEFAKNRPIGYNRDRLLTIPFNSPEIQSNYESFKTELLISNKIENISISSSATTYISSSANNLDWEGKDPNTQMEFGTILIDPAYGDVVEWEILEGRNFSADRASDSSGFIFNESAIKQMGLENPVGKSIKWHGRTWQVIGVVKDMVMRSPFEQSLPTVFLMDPKERSFSTIHIKLRATISSTEALKGIESSFKKYCPSAPFDYKYVDVAYGLKFASEERIGKLASVFSVLAIFISCLGLFGLASFIAEQRTKEIGIRKVVGASIFNLWGMLSKDFVVLVLISCAVATPIAYYFLGNWLMSYEYHTEISWWLFIATSGGALVITLLTVSYQAIKAAMMNPVRSLRSE